MAKEKKENVKKENNTSGHLLIVENAILDVLMQVSESDMRLLAVDKVPFTMIDEARVAEIEKRRKGMPVQFSLGGSAHNTGYLAHKLGTKVHLLTSIGDDEIGMQFSLLLEKTKIPNTLYVKSDCQTCRCYSFITPDGERTMLFYPGTASLAPIDMSEYLVKNARMVHITGFVFGEPQLAQLVKQVLDIAHKNNVPLSIDVGEVAGQYKDIIIPILTKQAAIIFANEGEAAALTDGAEPENAVRELGHLNSVVVVKKGANGSLVRSNDVVLKIEAFRVVPVDTTGAGDAYAGAFLHSHLAGKEIKKSAELASFLAAKVVEKIGARLEVLPSDDVLRILQ